MIQQQLDVAQEIEEINNDLNKYIMLKGDLSNVEFKMLEYCKKMLMDLKNKKVNMADKERALEDAMRSVLTDLLENYREKKRMDEKKVPEVGPLIDIYDKLIDIHLKLEDANKIIRKHQTGQGSRQFANYSKKSNIKEFTAAITKSR